MPVDNLPYYIQMNMERYWDIFKKKHFMENIKLNRIFCIKKSSLFLVSVANGCSFFESLFPLN